MLKIILVDDERAIRESISQLIDWKSLGLELVGVCKNGLEALDMILDETPDIVMTDIKMPGLTGVELVQRISQTALDTQFILLSGYGEFSYAQEAMRCGVRHYLLKPSSEEQIIDCLKKVIWESQEKKALHQLAHRQAEAVAVMQRGILMNIIAEAISDAKGDFAAICKPYQKYMDFTYTSYVVGFVYDIDRERVLSCYERIVEFHREQAPGIPIHAIYVKNCLMVFCPSYPLAYEGIKNLMNQMGNGRSPLNGEMRSFQNFAVMLDELLLYAHHYGTIFYVGPDKMVPINNFRGVCTDIKEICKTIRKVFTTRPEDEQAQLRAALEQLSQSFARIESLDYMNLLASTALFELADHDLCCSAAEAAELLQKLHGYDDANRVREELLDYLWQIVHNTGSTTVQGRLVQQIKEYVRNNLSDPNLTLKLIAETHLYMNVDYVSKRFLRETGGRFSSYLTEMRIQRAIQLLSGEENVKIQFIAEQVGCGNNPQYFSQVFKKATGMTPSAYARTLKNKG